MVILLYAFLLGCVGGLRHDCSGWLAIWGGCISKNPLLAFLAIKTALPLVKA
jgi:hypothetical protein